MSVVPHVAVLALAAGSLSLSGHTEGAVVTGVWALYFSIFHLNHWLRTA